MRAKLETIENELKEYAQKSGEQLDDDFKKINDDYISAQNAESRIIEIDNQRKQIEGSINEKNNVLMLLNGEIKDLLNEHKNQKEKMDELAKAIPENLKNLDVLLNEIKKLKTRK